MIFLAELTSHLEAKYLQLLSRRPLYSLLILHLFQSTVDFFFNQLILFTQRRPIVLDINTILLFGWLSTDRIGM